MLTFKSSEKWESMLLLLENKLSHILIVIKGH